MTSQPSNEASAMPGQSTQAFDLWSISLRTHEDFGKWYSDSQSIIQFRRSLQDRLQRELPAAATGTYHGFCSVCGCHSHFDYNWKYSDGKHLNWREQLACRRCQLSNRLRLSMSVAGSLVDLASTSTYLTEQVTPLAQALLKRYSSVSCSEYLGDGVPSGHVDPRGIRHEDLTCLSFDDAQFGLVLSFDVLEHIPNYRSAIREVRRVLRPGGFFLFSVPFDLARRTNLVRAVIRNGSIEHLQPPEYHGDPIGGDAGLLCFYHFGWQLLDDLKLSGFEDAHLSLYWSSDYAHIGDEQVLILASA